MEAGRGPGRGPDLGRQERWLMGERKAGGPGDPPN